ncbi:MAG: hypothetical protein ACREK6_06555 [Candidatus Rokuibacteriota bacterium]
MEVVPELQETVKAGQTLVEMGLRTLPGRWIDVPRLQLVKHRPPETLLLPVQALQQAFGQLVEAIQETSTLLQTASRQDSCTLMRTHAS